VRSRPLKLFWASSVHLWTVPNHHRAENGSKQVNVLIRCATKRRFAELVASVSIVADKTRVDSVYRHLSVYACWDEVIPDSTRYAKLNSVAVKPDTIYYNPWGHTVSGYVDEWFELPLRENPSLTQSI